VLSFNVLLYDAVRKQIKYFRVSIHENILPIVFLLNVILRSVVAPSLKGVNAAFSIIIKGLVLNKSVSLFLDVFNLFKIRQFKFGCTLLYYYTQTMEI